jgi:hypothetical protein
MRRTCALLLALSTIFATLLAVTATTSTASAASAAPRKHAVDGRIVFVRSNQIYTMSARGKKVDKLTFSGKNIRPQWSPDGQRISYIHVAKGQRDVWVMSAKGQQKRAVTTTGDVTSAGAPWSPDGQQLAFASTIDDNGAPVIALQLISSTDPSATPTVASGYHTGGECGTGPEDPVSNFFVDTYLAWAPGPNIAVKTSDCRFDYAFAMYHPATGEFAQEIAGGSDCCGYEEWTDPFFGPKGEFGYTNRDLGEFGEDRGPRRILYPGFASRAGDTGGAPSASGKFMAFTHTHDGNAHVMRAAIDGSHRRELVVGYQPDWAPAK